MLPAQLLALLPMLQSLARLLTGGFPLTYRSSQQLADTAAGQLPWVEATLKPQLLGFEEEPSRESRYHLSIRQTTPNFGWYLNRRRQLSDVGSPAPGAQVAWHCGQRPYLQSPLEPIASAYRSLTGVQFPTEVQPNEHTGSVSEHWSLVVSIFVYASCAGQARMSLTF